MSYVPDNYDLWEAHDTAQARQLAQLPVCGYCQNEIQDDFYYEIDEEPVCEECLNRYFRKAVEDYIWT